MKAAVGFFLCSSSLIFLGSFGNQWPISTLSREKITMVEDSTVETESMNSCDEAVRHIADRLDCESKKRLASAPRDDLILLLHGWGTQIRNECHLWENEPLRASCSRKKGAKGVMDAESASMVIIEGVWELVKNQ